MKYNNMEHLFLFSFSFLKKQTFLNEKALTAVALSMVL